MTKTSHKALGPLINMKKITLTTSDNIEIVGNYYESSRSEAPAVILLHMMPATKESWSDFAMLLVLRGFQVLAIDERGHGESTMNGELNYKNFSDKQHQEKILDIIVAREFFKEKGVVSENIFVGGGSIGANLVIKYMAENSECKAGFALSPGYDYKGIEAMPLMKKLNVEQSIYLVGSKDDYDIPDSYKAVEDLAGVGQAQKKIKIFDTGGHAENILKEHPEFMEELVNWLFELL